MLKRMILILIGTVLLYALLVWSAVLPRSSDAQLKAVALLRQPYQQAKGHHDAYSALWLINYDIPPEELSAAYQQDIAAYKRKLNVGTLTKYRSDLDKKYSYHPVQEFDFCPTAPVSCLSYARENQAEARELTRTFSSVLLRSKGLRQYDHVIDGFGQQTGSPLLVTLGRLGNLQNLSNALDFIDGKREQALDASCHDLTVWRRLRSHTDMYFVDGIALSYGRDSIMLIADMLAELPNHQALPPSCSEAFKSMSATELDQCDVARGSMKSIRSALLAAPVKGLDRYDWESGSIKNEWWSHFANGRASEARLAPFLATSCSGQVEANDEGFGLLDRIFDPAGVEFSDEMAMDESRQSRRVKDFANIVQALRTIVWLRGQNDLFTARTHHPVEMQASQQPLVWDGKQRKLGVLISPWRETDTGIFYLPFPASRLSSTAPKPYK